MKKVDLVVIGSGPAGLSAAAKASSYGAKVVIVDENTQPGGKLLGQLHEHPQEGWWIGQQVVKSLSEKVHSYGVELLQGREVWGLYPQWTVKLDQNEDIEASHVLIATGAAERPIPIPGWNIPGVMAVGAAQVMTNTYRVLPGKRILIIGVDVLSLTIARQLVMAGAEVVGIVLPPPGLFSQEKADPKFIMAYLSRMANMAPNAFLRIIGQLAKGRLMNELGARFYPKKGLRVWGIPLLLKKAAIEITGSDHVESANLVDLTANGVIVEENKHSVNVDCVCISGGLYPLVELAAAAGCQFTDVPELGGNVPLYGPQLQTTQRGLFVAGNITGIEGAKVASAQGELAGTAIAAELNLLGSLKESLINNAQEHVLVTRQNSDIQFHAHIHEGRRIMIEKWKEGIFCKQQMQ
jgi:sarcosine oxidase subunit alpha